MMVVHMTGLVPCNQEEVVKELIHDMLVVLEALHGEADNFL